MIKRAIVYGATGAIGRALLDVLLKSGATVLILGRGEGRMNEIPTHPRLTRRVCALHELAELQSKGDAPYDVFFYLGWAGTAGAARQNVDLQLKNVTATLDALEAAARFGCHTFLGAGSQAEYGPCDTPLSPTTPVFPQNAYGIAKLAAGLLSRERAQQLEMRHIWMRILSVYGPHDSENALLPYVARELLAGRTPVLTGGTQLWDYLYATDAAKALYLAALHGRGGATYVLGSGVARPLRDYVTALRDALSPRAPLGFGKVSIPSGAPTYLCADIEALVADTGWRVTVAPADGIAETAAFLRRKYAVPEKGASPSLTK